MPTANETIAKIFEEIADLLDIEGANPFRIRAYRNAARTVRGWGRDMAELVKEEADLSQLPGIGKELAAKIKEIVETGHAHALDELHKEVPATLEDLLQLPGLGPKRVKQLYEQLSIETLPQLEEAVRSGKLRELEGFGEKTETRILEALGAQQGGGRRFLLSEAADQAEQLTAWMRGVKEIKDIVVAGSYRRGKETVGDLDVLVTAANGECVMNRFVKYADVATVLSKGTTRATVVLKNKMQVDMRVVETQSFGAALHYFTGSKAHNIRVRRLGQQRGLKINEYGVFRGEKRIAGKTEASVFKAVGLPFIEPELREDNGEIEAAQRGKLPKLIEFEDLQGDLHLHTKASDGHLSARDMALAAKKRGFKYIAVTDHTRSLRIAHGLNVERLNKQIDEIAELNETLKGITLFSGAEVEILANGKLDLPDSILERLDVVIAAVHSNFKLPRAKQTRRILKAMDNPYVTMLAHPTGRLLGERDAYEADFETIIDHAAERGCILEINAQPKRLDLTASLCRYARERKVLVSINSDAHGEHDFDNLRFGIQQARRGWLAKTQVVNTRTLAQVKKALTATRLA